MKLNIVENTKRNIAAGMINRAINLVLPFLNRTLFLRVLGPDYLGLNGLFSSILGVLALAELGFETAIVCSMYKPIADDDHDLVCAYLHFYRTVYRLIGSFIFVAGLCLLPFLRQLIHGAVPSDVNLYILYLLYLTNTAVSYYLFAYRRSILTAHQRNDILTNINTAVLIIQFITVFAILMLTGNYYAYVIATIFFTVLRNLLVLWKSKRLFPHILPNGELPQNKRKQVIVDVKAIFLHKIGYVISYQIDNVILSACLGLTAVASYGNYHCICTAIAGVPAIVYSSISGGFGNKIHTESREKNFQLFMLVSRLIGIINILCAAMLLALYQPFISVWVRHDPKLILHFLTPLLMVIYFYVNQSRQALLSFKSGASLWREDQWKPVVGGIVKLLTCLLFLVILPENYKLDGVILSTIAEYVFVQIPWESHVVFSVFFDRTKAKEYWRHQFIFLLAVFLISSAAWGTATAIPLDGIPGLLVKCVAASLVSVVLIAMLFRKDILEIMKKGGIRI